MPAQAGGIGIGTCRTVRLQGIIQRLFQHHFDLGTGHIHFDQRIGKWQQLIGVTHGQIALGDVGTHTAAILDCDIACLGHFTERMRHNH